MATLTNLEEKLAEVYGLAQAAEKLTGKIHGLVDDEEVASTLERMRQEAQETADRCGQLAGDLDGKKTAIEEKARETRQEAEEMASTYLGSDADGLDGLEFMSMAEAGELAHVEVVGTMAESARAAEIRDLIQWAKPIQERHVQNTHDCLLRLAAEEDPTEEA
jgi:hypothetical protein